LDRILPWLALIIAVGVGVVAVVELDNRSEDDIRAVEPTTVPSPSELASPLATPEPTQDAAQATDEPATEVPETAAAPEPSKTATPEPTDELTPPPTVAPPRTPTPEPPLIAGPIDTSNGKTPTTGGSSLIPGLLLALCALALRAILVARARSSTG
jgi:outer membrane biosynthesis protein TonB